MDRYFNHGQPYPQEEDLLTPDNFKSVSQPNLIANSPINLLELLAQKDGQQSHAVNYSQNSNTNHHNTFIQSYPNAETQLPQHYHPISKESLFTRSVPDMRTQSTPPTTHSTQPISLSGRSQSTSRASHSTTPLPSKSPGRKYSTSVSPGRSAISSLTSSSPEERFSGAAYLSSPAPSALPLPSFIPSNSVHNQPNFSPSPSPGDHINQPHQTPNAISESNSRSKSAPQAKKNKKTNKPFQNNGENGFQSPNRNHDPRSKSTPDLNFERTQFSLSPNTSPVTKNRNKNQKNRNDNYDPSQFHQQNGQHFQNGKPSPKSPYNNHNNNGNNYSTSQPNLNQASPVKSINQNNHNRNPSTSSIDKPDTNNDYDNMSNHLKMMLNICSA